MSTPTDAEWELQQLRHRVQQLETQLAAQAIQRTPQDVDNHLESPRLRRGSGRHGKYGRRRTATESLTPLQTVPQLSHGASSKELDTGRSSGSRKRRLPVSGADLEGGRQGRLQSCSAPAEVRYQGSHSSSLGGPAGRPSPLEGAGGQGAGPNVGHSPTHSPYDADKRFFPTFGYACGEIVDRMISDQVISPRTARRVRVLLAAENAKMQDLVQAYEQEGATHESIETFRTQLAALLAAAEPSRPAGGAFLFSPARKSLSPGGSLRGVLGPVPFSPACTQVGGPSPGQPVDLSPVATDLSSFPARGALRPLNSLSPPPVVGPAPPALIRGDSSASAGAPLPQNLTIAVPETRSITPFGSPPDRTGIDSTPGGSQPPTPLRGGFRTPTSPCEGASPASPGVSVGSRSPKSPYNAGKMWEKVGKLVESREDNRPLALLVGSGTFNPVHKLHLRLFYLAQHYLGDRLGMQVVGGLVSPSHPTLVRQRHRSSAVEIIPPRHRLAMARAAVGESSFLTVDPWEITRKRIMDYMSVLEHVKDSFEEHFPALAADITILYLCKAGQVPKLNPTLLRAGGFGAVTVCRPLETERLLKELGGGFRDVAHVVEDKAILSAALEKTSTRTVLSYLKEGRAVESMVGGPVSRHMEEHQIAAKVAGKVPWTAQDKAFQFDTDDEDDRPYHNLPRTAQRRPEEMPLHH